MGTSFCSTCTTSTSGGGAGLVADVDWEQPETSSAVTIDKIPAAFRPVGSEVRFFMADTGPSISSVPNIGLADDQLGFSTFGLLAGLIRNSVITIKAKFVALCSAW